MKIGIDGSRLRVGATGVGRYTEGILTPLDRVMPDSNFVLYARRNCNFQLPSSRWTIRYDRHPAWSLLPTTYWIHYRLGDLVGSDNLDVFWAPNTLIPKDLSRNLPCVTTVLDFRHLLAPKDLPPITRHAHRKWFNADVRRAAMAVAISEGTSVRMQSELGRRADAVALPAVPVLPPVTDRKQAAQALAALGIRQPFLLTVGRSPCKNLAGVVNAVAMMKARGRIPNHLVVMAGAEAWSARVHPIGRADVYDWVKPVGYVSDAKLAALYSLADALVFPSFYEGFGIPVAEARAMGCRVVTTDSPELREAGGEGAVYVKPTPENIIEGLDAALSRPPPLPRRPGNDWADAAHIMATVFRSAAQR